MKVLIETDVELYPATTLLFGDEIRFPAVPQGCDQANCGLEVPGDVAERWRAARDAWRQVQDEAEEYLDGQRRH